MRARLPHIVLPCRLSLLCKLITNPQYPRLVHVRVPLPDKVCQHILPDLVLLRLPHHLPAPPLCGLGLARRRRCCPRSRSPTLLLDNHLLRRDAPTSHSSAFILDNGLLDRAASATLIGRLFPLGCTHLVLTTLFPPFRSGRFPPQ